MPTGKGASNGTSSTTASRSRSREQASVAATRGRSGAPPEELVEDAPGDDLVRRVFGKMEAKFDSQFRATTQGLRDTVAELDAAQRDRLAKLERAQHDA